MGTTKPKNILTQLLATFGALILQTQSGIIDGWTSPNVARLTDANSTIPLTLSEASQLSSYLTLGKFASVFFMPLFIDVAGSRKAILYTFIPVSIGWILTMIAKSATLLYIARFSKGITHGLSFVCFPIYLGEISTPVHRGSFIAIATLGWFLGFLIGTAGEIYFSGVVSSTVYLVHSIIGISLFVWLPDSPYHLVKRKELKRARQSLEWYRDHDGTAREMEEIVEFVEATSETTFQETMKQLRLPSIRKVIILITLLYACPQVCGVLNVVFKGVKYTSVVIVIFAIISLNLIDKLGRRILLIVSITLMAIAHVGLALDYYLINNTNVHPLSIEILLPVVSIYLLMGIFFFVYSPVMNTILGEMFPANFKSTAAIIATLSSTFFGFVSTLAYQPLINTIGESCVFWAYAVLMAAFLPILVFLLPETKGKSLLDIQKLIKQ